MSLTAPRGTVRKPAGVETFPVAAGAVCIQGGLAVLASGFARPGRVGQGGNDAARSADAATYIAVGIFIESVTGGVANGDQVVKIQAGEFEFKNSAGADAITLADVGRPAFIVDDDTVARTSAAHTRAPAGRITQVDDDGVWVAVGEELPGRRTVVLPFAINETDTLAGTSAELVSPVAGAITSMSVIVQKAVTTGGPVTASVGGVAVDGLSCVIADLAAKGTVVTDVPTVGHASRAVQVGSRIQVIPDPAFNIAGAVSGYVEITF